MVCASTFWWISHPGGSNFSIDYEARILHSEQCHQYSFGLISLTSMWLVRNGVDDWRSHVWPWTLPRLRSSVPNPESSFSLKANCRIVKMSIIGSWSKPWSACMMWSTAYFNAPLHLYCFIDSPCVCLNWKCLYLRNWNITRKCSTVFPYWARKLRNSTVCYLVDLLNLYAKETQQALSQHNWIKFNLLFHDSTMPNLHQRCCTKLLLRIYQLE